MTHNDLRYEFGPYQLNPSKRILTRDGEGIPLTPKATEILLVLVKHAGQLVEKAITHFRHAIKLDPNYALAYAAIVDCYLRLTTNYLPPEEDGPAIASPANNESDQIELRFERDWRSVERELRRAADLRVANTFGPIDTDRRSSNFVLCGSRSDRHRKF